MMEGKVMSVMKMSRKRLTVVVGLLLVLTCLLLVSTWALWTADSPAVNVIKTGTLSGEIVEVYNPPPKVDPGAEIDKVVDVKNTGDVDMFVRVKIDKVWGDGSREDNGDLIPVVPGLATDNIIISPNTDKWFDGGDGYYYYKGILAPGETTEESFFDSFTLDKVNTGNDYQGLIADIIVKMEAIQAGGNALPTEWGIAYEDLDVVKPESPEDADAQVVFVSPENKPEEFDISQGSTYSDTDLFLNFKDLVPGETRSQKVEVKNEYTSTQEIFLRAEFVEQLDETLEGEAQNLELVELLLRQYATITVEADGKTIYSGPVWGNYESEPTGDDSMKNYISIGDFLKDETKDLTIVLTLDPDIGNEYQDLLGLIKWRFLTEEVLVPVVSAEVDKDTIKRTSAAYVSLPGKEGFDNVGLADERYRYDIDFRSTSNVPLDEFVVDDPLEAVSAGQIVLDEFWTPVTWGDEDGSFYVLYQTNKTFNGSPGIDSNPSKKAKSYSNRGYRLWAGIDKARGLDAAKRQNLKVADLGLAKGEYVTAVRLDYGAVSVGFTSKNYSDVSQNGEWRDKDGNIFLPTKEDAAKIEPLAKVKVKGWIAGQARNDGGKDWIAGQARNDSKGKDIVGLASGIKGNVVDWTPASDRADYAAGAAGATGLKPASYLVSATQAIDEASIVTSVSAKVAMEKITDLDQDAVLTRVFSSFEMNPDVFDPSGSISENSFLENAEKNGVVMRGGKWYDAKTGKQLEGSELSKALGGGGIFGNSPITGDAMAVWIWILLAAIACALLVMVLRRRRRLKGSAK
ncbi:MAG: BsaA family SipW-dependent biofilm matrix protein [Clostridiales Family XIII bacterium]|nr:BsaA family SipW-dependent biofilm matrix protein [Clostridiales Family XIII bacterium]